MRNIYSEQNLETQILYQRFIAFRNILANSDRYSAFPNELLFEYVSLDCEFHALGCNHRHPSLAAIAYFGSVIRD